MKIQLYLFDVNGIGYEVNISLNTWSQNSKPFTKANYLLIFR
ncbi:MAG: OB-fold domain-containing protein [Chitinophagaceae bacterium]